MTMITGILIGVLSGVVTGFSGASGVIVIIPLITIFIGLPIYQAVGTSLLADVVISAPVAFTYYRYGDVSIQKSLWLLVGALTGAQLGSRFIGHVPGGWLALALALFLVIMGGVMLRQGFLRSRVASLKNIQLRKIRARLVVLGEKNVFLIVLGFALGILTGIFGAGGGLLAFLIFYFALKLPLKTAIGTSTFFMVFTALSGVFGHIGGHSVNLELGFLMGFGGVIGGMIASYLAHRIPETSLARVIGGVFIVLGVGMVFLELFLQ